VPLCAIHHRHSTAKEHEWWEERNIDPLIVANRLWQQSRERHLAAHEAADLPKVPEKTADRYQDGAGSKPGEASGTSDHTESASSEP
jgi:hypothetical protein